MKRSLYIIRVILALGVLNVLRVIIYKTKLRVGAVRALPVNDVGAAGEFFQNCIATSADFGDCKAWDGTVILFGHLILDLDGAMPNWHKNYITNQLSSEKSVDWWKIPDFDKRLGDIKIVWELSRFDWALEFAQRAVTGDSDSLIRMNLWLRDWREENRAFKGVNWKCGQEASIRVIHLAICAIILGQLERRSLPLMEMLANHLARISSTLSYAVAQNNNHGISEAAALYIGGSWLEAMKYPGSVAYRQMGRDLLEDRVLKLVENDGTFSQYSVNYHRLFLDTISIVEVWRKKIGDVKFSQEFYTKGYLATCWLRSVVDVYSGDAPNVGANDGAMLLPLAGVGYRDFRPSVQLSTAVYEGALAYTDEKSLAVLKLLQVDSILKIADSPSDYIASSGGFAMLRRSRGYILFRYPMFKFRPSQADCLHLDFWLNGENVLRDSGTFSYNADVEVMQYFSGPEGHNTIQFDSRDQMPKLGRFLYGEWVRTDGLDDYFRDEAYTIFGAGYRDWLGARHWRNVALGENKLVVTDDVRGFARCAVLRWRFRPGALELDLISENEVRIRLLGDLVCEVIVCSSVPYASATIVEGLDSKFYQNLTGVPVLEVAFERAATITSTFNWL